MAETAVTAPSVADAALAAQLARVWPAVQVTPWDAAVQADPRD